MPERIAVTPGPVRLQVEVTAACNLRCRMCIVRYRPPVKRNEGTLSLACFERILDEVPTAREVVLQGIGEPLLVPHLPAMVALARGRGLSVGFNTNATLLTAAKSDALVRAGLSWLCISIDGAGPEVYEDVRDGARFERVARNVRALVATKARLGAASPELRLVFVAMRRNLADLPGVVGLAADWGVPAVRVQNLSHTFSDADASGQYLQIRSYTRSEGLWRRSDRETVERVFGAARAEAERRGVDLRLPAAGEHPVSPRGCDWPWEGAYVNFDGAVQPCCMLMGSERGRLGHLDQESFGEVWNGPAYQDFRRRLESGDPPSVCRGCSEYRGVF